MASGAPDLGRMFKPGSVAVVGASASPSKAGHQLVRALDCFPGEVHPVNPRAGEVAGRAAYASIGEIPSAPDLAMLAIPPPALPPALRECGEAGVGAAVVCTGGLRESGAEGAAIEAELGRIADETGIEVLGPNTSGFLSPPERLYASFLPSSQCIEPGPLGIVAQSGGVNHALAFLAAQEGIGVRLAVGLGNAMRTGFVRVVEYLLEQSDVDVIVLHVEGVADGRALFETVDRATERVPVIAAMVGRADVAAFARSHTGALTGSRRVTRAALAQAGAVVVEDSTELIDAARGLASVRLPATPDPGVGLVSGQAGPALLLLDHLRASGVRIPPLEPPTRRRIGELLPPLTFQENPVDTGRPDAGFPEVLRAVAADPGVDVLGAYQLHEPEVADPVEFLADVGVPVVFGTAGPTGMPVKAPKGTTVYPTPERAATALRALVADARAAHRRSRRPERTAWVDLNGERPPRPLNEHEGKRMLQQLGVRVPEGRRCRSRLAVHEALTLLGPPLAVKLLDPAVPHKSDAGAVWLGISHADELDRALDAIDRAATATTDGYLVERMVRPGPELIAGARVDESFGPVVLLAAGGVLAEALDDAAVRLAPLSRIDAEEMLDELRSAQAYDGFRGGHRIDRGSLADVLIAFSRLVCRGELREVEVNPLRVTSSGLVALDVFAET